MTNPIVFMEKGLVKEVNWPKWYTEEFAEQYITLQELYFYNPNINFDVIELDRTKPVVKEEVKQVEIPFTKKQIELND